MTDEEKKAIEILRKVKDEKPFVFWFAGECYNKTAIFDILLDLIEKQSKEIEELKVKNKKLQDKCKELIFEKQELTSGLLDSTPNDKIKAKIEELNKDFKEYENGQEWEIQDEIRGQIEVLQSLLEKE